MLGVLLTVWLLLQLPVALALGRFIGCPRGCRNAGNRERSPHRRNTPAEARVA